MKGRLPLYVLLASALTFLASLFLPWRESSASSPNFPFGSGAGQGLFNLVSGVGRVDGWLAISGDVAVLLVLAIVLATVAALGRPPLAARLPIAGLGVALGYFAIAVAHESHTLASELSGGFTGKPRSLHTSWAYGFYLGVAGAGIAALSALAYRRSELLRLRGAGDAAALVLGIGVLTSFLLPWVAYPGGVNNTVHGIEAPPAAIAALGLFLGGGWLQGGARRRWRMPCAIAAAILTGGTAAALGVAGAFASGAWIGIACAILLVVLEAVRALLVRLAIPSLGSAVVRPGAAALLIAALFLPWRELHAGAAGGVAYDGWYASAGAAAGGLCLLLLAAPILPAIESYVLDLVVAVAIFVSIAGTQFRADSPFFKLGYGAFIGIAAAGILLVTALGALRPGHMDRNRALARAVPLAASVLCLAAIVVPLWFLLPVNWSFQADALYGSFAVPGVLLGLYLVRLWAGGVRGSVGTGHRLTLVPLVLLTLASLELIRFRGSGDVLWSAIILVGLCLVLMGLGWIEEHRGLEGIRVPEEIWRVDRLPEPES